MSVGRVTPIDVLPDDVLLEIFDFCVACGRNEDTKGEIEGWQSLVHVCRGWRSLVFGSPRRLNLRLVCTPKTPARECLDVWPPLRLQIQSTTSSQDFIMIPPSLLDNIIVPLGHSDRVCRIDLRVDQRSEPQWDKVLATMQVPFPELVDLRLESRYSDTHTVIPDTFLGGSAARLQYLKLSCISFPGIQKLLLSTTHLVQLSLRHIPHSGYISPEAMATCLSMLTSLVTLSLGFLSSRSRPDRECRTPPPVTHSILPDLTSFDFDGVSEYLDDLVARIDTPRLDNLDITFLHQINFDTPHLAQFIRRTPRFEKPDVVDVCFDYEVAEVQFLSGATDDDMELALCVRISCDESAQQLASMVQVCTMCLPPLFTVEKLRVLTKEQPLILYWNDDVANNQWLELLLPFTAVNSLYLSKEFQRIIMSTLRELVVEGRATEALPSLQNIFLETFEPSGPIQEAIGQFVSTRQISSHPIAYLPFYDY